MQQRSAQGKCGGKHSIRLGKAQAKQWGFITSKAKTQSPRKVDHKQTQQIPRSSKTLETKIVDHKTVSVPGDKPPLNPSNELSPVKLKAQYNLD